MIFWLVQFALSECTTVVSATGKVQFFHFEMLKNETVCFVSENRNLFVGLKNYSNCKLEYVKKSIENDGKREDGFLQDSPYVFFQESIDLVIRSEARTSIDVEVVAVPNECKNRFWYTNQENTTFEISDSGVSPFKFLDGPETCVFFGILKVSDFSIEYNLPNPNDFVAFSNQKLTGANSKEPFVTIEEDIIRIKASTEGSSRFVKVSNLNEKLGKPQIPFSGFIKPLKPQKVSQPKLWVLIGTFCILALSGVLVYIFVFSNRWNRPSGYSSVNTIL